MAGFGVSNDLILTHVKETTTGVTPANPTLKRLRITGESLTAGVTYDESAEINPNYDLTDLIATGTEAGGSVPYEFSKTSVLDDILEAVLRGAWTTNVLKAGKLKSSFTLEKSFIGGSAGTRKYMSFPGTRYNGITLGGSIGNKLAGSIDAMSLSGIPSTTSIVGTGSTTEPESNRVLALVDMSVFTMAGDATPLVVSEFNLSITNNMRRQGGHGQLASYDIGYGMREVTLTFSAYYEDWEQQLKLLNRGTSNLTLTLTDGTNSYTFVMPKLKYRSATVQAGGNNADLMQAIEARALIDATAATSLQVTRAP